MAQSLARREDLADATARYGLVVIDECHHVPAVTFERAVRQIPARRWLGLTATPYRRDGLQAMMAMYSGPIRHRMPEMRETLLLHRELVVHETQHEADDDLHIQEVFRGVVSDRIRTASICRDIASSASEGRNSLVLTRWTEHLEAIVEELRNCGNPPLVLRGGMGKKSRRDSPGPAVRTGSQRRDPRRNLELPWRGLRLPRARYGLPGVPNSVQGEHRAVRGPDPAAGPR